MVPVNENYPSSPKAELGDFEVTKKTDSKQRWVVWVVCSLVSKRNTPFGILDFGGGHRIYIYIYMITYVKIHVYLDGLTILDGLDGLTALLLYRTYAMCFTVHM